jgi:hypothetical protein
VTSVDPFRPPRRASGAPPDEDDIENICFGGGGEAPSPGLVVRRAHRPSPRLVLRIDKAE